MTAAAQQMMAQAMMQAMMSCMAQLAAAAPAPEPKRSDLTPMPAPPQPFRRMAVWLEQAGKLRRATLVALTQTRVRLLLDDKSRAELPRSGWGLTYRIYQGA